MHNTLSNKIISSDKDMVGVVFYGTVSFQPSANSSYAQSVHDQDKHSNKNAFQHVYVMYELDTPDVKRITDLEKMAAGLWTSSFVKYTYVSLMTPRHVSV